MSEEELSTKEKIIQAAFSLLKTQGYNSISLSRIAKEVSISKTAIYRHFKNKDDLDLAIRERIASEVLVHLKEVDALYKEKKYDECLVSVLRFMKLHPEYVNYSLFSTPDVGEDQKLYQFHDAGISFAKNFYDENHNIINHRLYNQGLFVIVTIIDFVLSWFGLCCKCGAPYSQTEQLTAFNISYADFEVQVIKLIKNGLFDGLAEGEVIQYENSFAAMDTLCLDSMKALPPLDKKLVALANVVHKVGFPNVTVEALANELGMVKSSLYTWFSDKKEMLKSLISPEINMMISTILDNMEKVEGLGNKLYVLLRTETLYFVTRKKMLSACKWIQIYGNFEHEGFENVVSPEFSKKVNEAIGKLIVSKTKTSFPCFDLNLLMGWIFSFPVFLVVNALHHKFTENEMHSALRSLYYMIAGGLNLEENMNKNGGNR
ncbi:MAG: TetR/AcrR family transcriptional regulator [Treponema sp.]|nr:TetR/AcrR family transcriptional regulator [Treponema sp.]